jgi:cobalt-zinc-cadmium efflux system outer membrane protein
MKMPYRLNFYLVIVLLSGCVGFHPKPLSPEEAARAFSARTLTDPGLQKFMGKTTGSWDLDAWTMAALYYHPDLDVARAQWKTAQAGERTAGERPNPMLSLGPTWVSNPDAGLSPWIAGFSFDIPIETAGKRGIRRRQAAALAEAARQNLAQTAWQIRSRVRAALLAYFAAQKSKWILIHQGKELDENARLLSERSANGSASPFNASQAALLAGRNRLALQDALRQEADSRSQLADAIGVPAGALKSVSLSSTTFASLPDPGEAILSQARRAALLGRPDLLSALASYAANEAALEQEIAKQYPDLHLGPGFAYDQGQDKWSLGLTFPLPIFNQNKGLIAEAQSRREEAAARFLALQDKIINEVDRARAAYCAARRKLAMASDVLARQTKQDRALRGLLRPGDVSRLTLFRSRLDIDSTALARVEALRQAQEALGVLEDALEHPLAGLMSLPAEAIEKNPREAYPR